MPRRVLTCRIDPRTATPFDREFSLDPLKHILSHRLILVAAALTLIRGWLASGSEPASGKTASFEDWDRLVRQTVCWVSREVAPGQFGDVMDKLREAQGSDPEQESLHELLTLLRAEFDDQTFTAADVSAAAAFKPELSHVLEDLSSQGRLNPRVVARILRYRKGRIVGGLSLQSVGDNSSKRGVRWRVHDQNAALTANAALFPTVKTFSQRSSRLNNIYMSGNEDAKAAKAATGSGSIGRPAEEF